MKSHHIASVAALLAMTTGPVLYGQTGRSASGDRASGNQFGFSNDSAGFGGGSAGGRSAGMNRIDRGNRLSSSSASRDTGDNSSGTRGRLDRNQSSSVGNPRSPRGINVRAGDAAQQPGGMDGTGRPSAARDLLLFDSAPPALDIGRTNPTGTRNVSRPQYVTRKVAAPMVHEGDASESHTDTDPAATIQESLSGLSGTDVQVDFDGDTAVLRGVVSSESDRRISERMVKLEPGVRHVRNELLVTGSSPRPAPSPSLP